MNPDLNSIFKSGWSKSNWYTEAPYATTHAILGDLYANTLIFHTPGPQSSYTAVFASPASLLTL